MDPIDNSSATASYDFENPINLAEDKGEDDCEVPGELARLLLQEERAIQPHEEPVEIINLGTEADRKAKGIRNPPITALVKSTYFRMASLFSKRGEIWNTVFQSGQLWSES